MRGEGHVLDNLGSIRHNSDFDLTRGAAIGKVVTDDVVVLVVALVGHVGLGRKMRRERHSSINEPDILRTISEQS